MTKYKSVDSEGTLQFSGNFYEVETGSGVYVLHARFPEHVHDTPTFYGQNLTEEQALKKALKRLKSMGYFKSVDLRREFFTNHN